MRGDLNIAVPHSFHVPVMGVGFTIDTPIKVAHLGITSVMSIGDDLLAERMREHYSKQLGKLFTPIHRAEHDCRARRISAYLNLVNEIVQEKFQALYLGKKGETSDLDRYFQMLPETSSLRQKYMQLDIGAELSEEIKSMMLPGEMEVNIMTKLDRQHYDKEGNPLATEFCDAHAALRGYAQSNINSGIVLSAGLNPRLYSYIANFDNFFPTSEGFLDKKVILKVSDYRSALVQGKFLAKKGVWVSEYRVESGLNCGGHAFATNGYLLGPILEEFKQNRSQLENEVHEVLTESLQSLNKPVPDNKLPLSITVQGGVGTHEEHEFLLQHYGVNSVGWATPFLLVPEAVNVDEETTKILVDAGEEELYLSSISPIGVPFNTVKGNTKDIIKHQNIEGGNPGSTCPREYLKLFNTEFTKQPICLSSKQYQKLKIKELEEKELSEEKYRREYNKITEKACLCTGLVVTAYMEHDMVTKPDGEGVSVCPGPNLAYFSEISSLDTMVGHIYGKNNLLNDTYRPNMFIKELGMYVDYFKKELQEFSSNESSKELKRLEVFKQNLNDGIMYYNNLFQSSISNENAVKELQYYQHQVQEIQLPVLSK